MQGGKLRRNIVVVSLDEIRRMPSRRPAFVRLDERQRSRLTRAHTLVQRSCRRRRVMCSRERNPSAAFKGHVRAHVSACVRRVFANYDDIYGPPTNPGASCTFSLYAVPQMCIAQKQPQRTSSRPCNCWAITGGERFYRNYLFQFYYGFLRADISFFFFLHGTRSTAPAQVLILSIVV